VCHCILTSRRLCRTGVSAQRPSLGKLTNRVCRRHFRLTYDKTTVRPQFPKFDTEIPVSSILEDVEKKTDGASEKNLKNAFRALQPNRIMQNRWHNEMGHFNARLRTLTRQLTASHQTRQRLDWLLRGKNFVGFQDQNLF
jgi:hypothetical protein